MTCRGHGGSQPTGECDILDPTQSAVIFSVVWILGGMNSTIVFDPICVAKNAWLNRDVLEDPDS